MHVSDKQLEYRITNMPIHFKMIKKIIYNLKIHKQSDISQRNHPNGD